MKDYCTQNNGDCSTCSLVNYGRDCRNKPIKQEYQTTLIRLTPDQHEKLRRISFESRIPMSELIRQAIDEKYMRGK